MKLSLLKNVNMWLFAISAVALPTLQADHLESSANGAELENLISQAEAEVEFAEAVDEVMDRFFATFGIYSHEAIHAIVDGDIITDPEVVAINARITQASLDIGLYLAAFYGAEVADTIAVAFATYAVLEEEYAIALVAGDLAGANAILVQWRAQGAAIAAYLGSIDPSDISTAELTALFDQHTTTEAFQIANYVLGNYTEAIAFYDQSRAQLIAIGNYLAEAVLDGRF